MNQEFILITDVRKSKQHDMLLAQTHNNDKNMYDQSMCILLHNVLTIFLVFHNFEYHCH